MPKLGAATADHCCVLSSLPAADSNETASCPQCHKKFRSPHCDGNDPSTLGTCECEGAATVPGTGPAGESNAFAMRASEGRGAPAVRTTERPAWTQRRTRRRSGGAKGLAPSRQCLLPRALERGHPSEREQRRPSDRLDDARAPQQAHAQGLAELWHRALLLASREGEGGPRGGPPTPPLAPRPPPASPAPRPASRDGRVGARLPRTRPRTLTDGTKPHGHKARPVPSPAARRPTATRPTPPRTRREGHAFRRDGCRFAHVTGDRRP